MDTEKVKQLNDAFRRSTVGGKFMFTSGVAALDKKTREEIVLEVRKFNNFNESNDPFKEHDASILTVKGIEIYWKIDYYDNDMKYHSPDKSDPLKTKRVLTIMKASEW